MSNNINYSRRGIGLKWLSIMMIVLTVIVTGLLFYTGQNVSESSKQLQESSDAYIREQIAASQLKQGSDNLTTHVRSFAVTGKEKFLAYYFTELNDLKTYDNAYAELEPLVENTSLASSLEMINDYETKLKELEGRSILLAMDYYGVGDKYREYLSQYSLSDLEKNMEPEEKRNKAIDLVFGGNSELVHFGDYDMHKKIVNDNIEFFVSKLAVMTQNEQSASMKSLDSSIWSLRWVTACSMVFLFLVAFTLLRYVVAPLLMNIAHINEHDFLEEMGVDELRYLANSYNQMLAKFKDNQKKLSYEASHDALTGLFNRQAYLDTYPKYETEKICFLHIDVDNFKFINDTYGHDIGDRFLQKVAKILMHCFRSYDMVFRLGGDEFAVIMVNVDEDCKDIITQKAETIQKGLGDDTDGVPKATVSIGAAFTKGDGTIGNMYKEADLALYTAKNRGKGMIVYYDESMSDSIPEE
ncbi:MAG: GGDEF domain-containing protein [Erysipelotrichaceae bacterium]|nr:GGDEF domain-containing protein [Erysipelotrichaceae bacterium]